MLRVLLTNDDGIGEPGLLALVRVLAPYCDVLVVAPDSASSGSSHSISLREPLYLQQHNDYAARAGVSSERLCAFSCSGRPSDCVLLAHYSVGAGNPPHLVISGINHGCNVAEDMTYSGTIGAALEGALQGIPSLALSLDTERGGDFAEAAELASLVLALLVYGHSFPWQLETLRMLRDGAGKLFTALDGHFWPLVPPPAGAGTCFPTPDPHAFPKLIEHAPCFNINLPGVRLAQTGGIRWSVGGVRKYVDAVSQIRDSAGRECYFIGGEKVLQDDDTPGSDTHALTHAYVSVTPITYDLTNRHEAALFREHLAGRMAAGQAWAAPAERGVRK